MGDGPHPVFAKDATMTQVNITYKTYTLLSCRCEEGSEVIICVDPSLTATGAPYLEGTISSYSEGTDTCGRTLFSYYLQYDDADLADPATLLLQTQISGVICKGCLTNYIDWLTTSISVLDTQSIDLTFASSVLSADAKISSDADNIIEIRADGLYATAGTGDAGWGLLGNAGTVENTNFIGTTDNVPFSVRVNNTRCMKALYNATSPYFLNGFSSNTNNSEGSAVLSGGMTNFINSIDKLTYTVTTTYGFSVIAGGRKNIVKGYMGGSSILGGYDNEISTPPLASFIGSCENSVIGGGYQNKVQSSAFSGVLSGAQNIIRPNASPLIYNSFGGDVICGGGVNIIQGGDQNVISGGSEHIIQNAANCCIGGGYDHTLGNTTAGRISSNSGIFTGRGNILYASFSSILGGNCNQITSSAEASDFRYNAILGGVRNLLADVRGSSILGGYALQLGDHSLGFEGLAFTTPVSPSQALCDDTLTNISAFDQVAYFGSVDIWVGNVDNDASKIKFFQANTSRTYTNAYYSSFEAQTQAGDIEYILPAALPNPGDSLKANTIVGNVVTLIWSA